jgi:hypothetical protein
MLRHGEQVKSKSSSLWPAVSKAEPPIPTLRGPEIFEPEWKPFTALLTKELAKPLPRTFRDLASMRQRLSQCFSNLKNSVEWEGVPAVLRDSPFDGKTLESIRAAKNWLRQRIDADIECRSVGDISLKYNVFILHGFERHGFAPARNSPLVDGVTLRERLEILLALGPPVACSHFSPERTQAINLWSPVGVILADGIVLGAHVGDAGSQAEGAHARSTSRGGPPWIHDQMNLVVEHNYPQTEESWPPHRYSELLVAAPVASGLYLYRSDSGLQHSEEFYADEELERSMKQLAEDYNLPLYVIDKGVIEKEMSPEHRTISPCPAATVLSSPLRITPTRRDEIISSWLSNTPFRHDFEDAEQFENLTHGFTNYNLVNSATLQSKYSQQGPLSEYFGVRLACYERDRTLQYLDLVKATFRFTEGVFQAEYTSARGAKTYPAPSVHVFLPLGYGDMPSDRLEALLKEDSPHQAFLQMFGEGASAMVHRSLPAAITASPTFCLEKYLESSIELCEVDSILLKGWLINWSELLFGYAMEAARHGDVTVEKEVIGLVEIYFSDATVRYAEAKMNFLGRVSSEGIRISKEECRQVLDIEASEVG